LLRNYFAIAPIALLSLPIALQSLRNRFAIALQSLSNHFAIIFQSPYARFAIASLSLLTRFAIALQLLSNRFAVALQPLCSCFAIALQLLSNRFATTLQSPSCHFPIARRSPFNPSAIVLRSLLQSTCNRCWKSYYRSPLHRLSTPSGHVVQLAVAGQRRHRARDEREVEPHEQGHGRLLHEDTAGALRDFGQL
jgi:hypothetical protein